ncbi:envelope glycoprotein [Simian immunodeficiency virus]|uniref:Envelope glycoprotein gp160 n=1 Tax=Simian immunodeficiency virus TaxID=11723 RepID=A0A0A7RS47_SIV|nr:envelope glycoprotein [Simian immunodeficiency virus]
MIRHIVIGLCILGFLGLSIGKHWVTVFYGTPKWRPASTHLICATDNHSFWVTTSCIPSLLHYEETQIENIEENFTVPMTKNEVIKQAWGALSSMIDAVLKPCVKINPYCVKMECTDGPPQPTTTTATSTSTTSAAPNTTADLEIDRNNTEPKTETNRVCKYNVTGLCRDCKEEITENFRYDDVVCKCGSRAESPEENNCTESRICYVHHCNSTVITQDCNKASTDMMKFRLCAPPGYIFLRCNEKLNKTRKCRNITAVQCTRHMPATISSMFGFNGTKHDQDELIETRGRPDFIDHKYVFRVDRKWNLRILCRRKGNRSIVSTPSATGLLFYHGLEPGRNLKRGMCIFQGHWGMALESLAKELKKVNASIWRNTNKTSQCNGLKGKTNATGCLLKQLRVDNYTAEGDLASENLMMMCGGEYFFCNVTKIWKTWNNRSSSVWYPYASCHIKQIIDDWAKVGRKIYMPPVSGFNNEIRCTQEVTEMFFEVHRLDTNVTDDSHYQIKFIPQDEVQNQSTAVGAHYKLVKVEPIGFAPTDVHRYNLPEHRQKRGAVVLGILGLLSLAGSTMGSVATAMTVQSQALLNGIVEQQKQLLRLVEQQQELLKLTIWGVKNLQARLTALEEYVGDQAKLSLWGCSFAQVCHTNVEWPNETVTPNWTSETWMEWQKRVDSISNNITLDLQKAYEQEQKNIFELQKLGDLTSWANWFDFTWWFKYIKIGFFVVIVIIGLRILAALWSTVGRFRQGYRPLPYIFKDAYRPETTSYHRQPDKEKGEEPGRDEWNTRSEPSRPESSRSWSKETVETWLKESRGYIWLKNLIAVLEYGWSELQEAGRSICALLQEAAERLWRGGRQLGLSTARALRAFAQALANIPRRIRQGAEVLLN